MPNKGYPISLSYVDKQDEGEKLKEVRQSGEALTIHIHQLVLHLLLAMGATQRHHEMHRLLIQLSHPNAHNQNTKPTVVNCLHKGYIKLILSTFWRAKMSLTSMNRLQCSLLKPPHEYLRA